MKTSVFAVRVSDVMREELEVTAWRRGYVWAGKPNPGQVAREALAIGLELLAMEENDDDEKMAS